MTVLINYLLTEEWPAIYVPEYKTITVGTGSSAVTFRMLLVEGGTMMMGAREGDPYARPWEYPVHEVTLSDYLREYHVVAVDDAVVDEHGDALLVDGFVIIPAGGEHRHCQQR